MSQVAFDKYKKWGDYHWREFARKNSVYRRHALKVQAWVTEQYGLDVGCGDGLITHLLGSGWSGIDVDQLAIKLARHHGVRAFEGSIYDLTGQFEAVYCGDVLEHLEYPSVAIHSISRVTTVLYLVTPPRRGMSIRPHHLQEWTNAELLTFLAEFGWKTDELIVTENDRMYGKFHGTR